MEARIALVSKTEGREGKGREKKMKEEEAAAAAVGGEEEVAIRIFVGGLGESVSSDDLHNIFSSNKSLGLGIQSMEITRSKGRSFAYINFLPSSNNSLTKLFNTYNGCVWKGGKLRLEKAKEHYLTRMMREWAQDRDALLSTPSLLHAQDDPTNKKQPISGKPNSKELLSENKQLRLFFPRLGKLKSIPLSGTGKHRYSFRRVEVPPLTKHFCDCEEHSSPPPPAKLRHIPTKEEQGAGMDEEELNLMSSVMNKLFQMENVSDNACRVIELDKQGDDSIKTNDDPPLEDNGDIDEDDDDLIINIVSGAQETISTGQKSRFNIRQISKDELSQNGLKKWKKNTAPFNKKRKAEEITTHREIELDKPGDDSIKTNDNPPLEDNGDIDEDNDNLIINMASGAQETIIPDQKSRFNRRQTPKDELSQNVVKKQKRNTAPANKKRKSVLHEDNNTNEPTPAMPGGNVSLLEQQSKFDNASEILPGHSSSKEEQSKSDNVPSSRDSENNNSSQQENQNEQFGSIKEVGGHVEAQSTKLDSASNKPGRGYAWLNKSSWTQLVAENNSNGFSITQILPGITFGKVEPSKPEGLEFARSMKSTHDDMLKKSNIDPTIDGTSDLEVRKECNVQNTITMSQQIVVGNTKASAPVVEKKSNSALKQTYSGDVSIGETCSFMRTAASVKEWARTRAALSGSRKRKNNEN